MSKGSIIALLISYMYFILSTFVNFLFSAAVVAGTYIISP